MSGPVEPTGEPRWNDVSRLITVREGRTTNLGGMGIRRVLPTKRRRTVGPWCFVDQMTPDDTMTRSDRLEPLVIETDVTLRKGVRRVECRSSMAIHGRWAVTGWVHGDPPEGWLERLPSLRGRPVSG